MANFKKVIVPKGSLPAINANTESYVVRFRVVSEDRNRISHWSPQYILPLEPATVVESNIVDVLGSTINVSWIGDDAGETVYQVYPAWGFTNTTSVGSIYPDSAVDETDLNKYYYRQTTGNSVSFAIPMNDQGVVAKAVKVYVQKISYPKGVIAPSRIVAESPVTDLT